jgi:hypothetical protein
MGHIVDAPMTEVMALEEELLLARQMDVMVLLYTQIVFPPYSN